MMHQCSRCGVSLHSDEIALYRKLVYHCAKTFLCMDCLAEDFKVPRKWMEDLVAYYHRTGVCSLFVMDEEADKEEIL